jgi:hypothetical protein
LAAAVIRLALVGMVKARMAYNPIDATIVL